MLRGTVLLKVCVQQCYARKERGSLVEMTQKCVQTTLPVVCTYYDFYKTPMC